MKNVARDAPGRELHDREGRTGATGYGWPAALVGPVFAAAGGFLLTLALVPLRESGVSPDVAGTLVGGSFGIVFVTMGPWLAAFGVLGVCRRLRVRRGRQTRSGEPWCWDHGRDARGVRDDARRHPMVWALRLASLTLFLVPVYPRRPE